MTTRQRTFELVPTSLVKQNASRPPMTSKAAKKAYLAAQKGPRISRAEQRKRDAAEYERIRKEHEKEKNAAKAKAARDKKAEKEAVAKEARKKSGLPEPNRFVRASQPTISRFVRGDSSAQKRSWKEMNDVAEETEDMVSDSDGEETNAAPPAKRIAIEQESDDEFGDFPALSPSALLKIDSSTPSLREEISAPPSPAKQRSNTPPAMHPLPPEEDVRKTRISSHQDSNSFSLDDVSERLLSEAAEQASRDYASEPPALPPALSRLQPQSLATAKLVVESPYIVRQEKKISESPKTTLVSNKPVSNSRPILQDRSINTMPPPRLPIKKPSTAFATPLAKPKKLPQNKAIMASMSLPPSATQAFLEDHLDDFFLSPSQQVRELLDDIDDVPSNTQIAREIGPPIPLTQRPLPPPPPKPVFDEDPGYFICTQDLVLTPQDLEEIDTPSRAQPKAIENSFVTKTAAPTRPVSRDRPRFFEEKAEDVHQAPPQDPRSHAGLQTQRNTPSPAIEQRVGAAKQDKPRSGRFFEEKEEDLVKAALDESKIMAPKQNKSSKGNPRSLVEKNPYAPDYENFDFGATGGGFYEDEEQRMLRVAIEESKKLAAMETLNVPAKVPPKRSTRSLTRVLSTNTDYGEDDFSGCSQELAAMC